MSANETTTAVGGPREEVDALRLVDIGVNLTDKSFHKDREQVVERALAAGVGQMVLTGTSVRASRAAAELAATRPDVMYATCGVHPHDASSFGLATPGELRELAALPQVVAIGECGLDYNRDFSPRPAQRAACVAQVQLACELGMPLFLHERDAAEDMLAILGEHRSAISAAVVHCFTGDGDTLMRYLELDLHIGITGWICDERRGLHLRDLVAHIPRDRLMLETDAPYLLPRTIRPRPKSRRNEPAFLTHVLATIADCTGRSPEQVAGDTTATARRFFSL